MFQRGCVSLASIAPRARTNTQLFERKTDALDFRKNFNPSYFSLAAMELSLSVNSSSFSCSFL
jgi:hypothetical protein